MARDKYGGYGYAYAPAPVAPKMEITINQGTSAASTATSPAPTPSISPYAASTVGTRRPPASAPPPPPSYHPDPAYSQDAYNPMWIDRFPKVENRGMFRLCLVELMLALVIFAGGIWCYNDTPDYCPYYSAVWTSVIYIANGIVGSAAAKIGSLRLYMAHLVLSLISIGMCLISGGLSARNWITVGTYDHPRVQRGQAFCLLGTHDPGRVSHIFTHMSNYDFAKCLYEVKVGVAVNSVQFIIAAIEVFLNILSAILCLKRTCRVH